MATDTATLDEATSRVTAFRSFAELVQACRDNSYVPTLFPRGPREHARDIGLVTRALEELGYRVYKGRNNTV
jgi:hypothetical protein